MQQSNPFYQIGVYRFESLGFKKSIEIVSELAKEYNNDFCEWMQDDVGEGVYKVHNRGLLDHNWHRGGYGKITLKQGLACNSSIAVAKATQMAGVEAVDSLVTPFEMLKLFNGIIKNDSLKSALRYYITDGLGKQASSDKVEVAGFSGRRTI